jgi:hypothetical protein
LRTVANQVIAKSELVPKLGGSSTIKDSDGHLNQVFSHFFLSVQSPPHLSTPIHLDRDKQQWNHCFESPVDEDLSNVT